MPMKLQTGQRWITVRPHGEDDEGYPVLINGDGTIAAGLGGKFNGKHVAHAFGGGAGSAGVVHGGAAAPHVADLPEGAHAEHNKHLATYGGLTAIADVTVHGKPEGDAEGGYGVHLKTGALDRLRAGGVHATHGGAFLAAHPSGSGTMYYGSPQPGEHYDDFAKRMSEDVLSHALHEDDSPPAKEHEDSVASDEAYRADYEREAREHTRSYMKHIRDTIRAEGGIRAERTQTEGQAKKGKSARQADEYRYLPAWAKNNAPDSPTLDQMAERLGHSFPELNIHTADDLGEYLMKHHDWLQADKEHKAQDDATAKRTRAEQRAAAKKAKADADAAKKAAKANKTTAVKESATMDQETTVREATGSVNVREAGVATHGALPRIPVVFMTAGPGNARQNNVYTPQAVEALVGEIKRQPKMYISHPDDATMARVGHRPLQDLGAIAVRETVHYDAALNACAAEVIPTPAMQAYLDVARAAGDNIGVSVNGVGLCEPGTRRVVSWKSFTSADFVPVGGAGGYTRLVRESEAPALSPAEQKELDMELLKTTTPAEVREANRELYEAIVKEAASAAPTTVPGVTTEQHETVVKENAALAERLTKAEAKLTEADVREAQRQASDIVSKTLADKPLTVEQAAYVARQFAGQTFGAGSAFTDGEAFTTAVREAADSYIGTLPRVSGQLVGLGGGAPTPAPAGSAAQVRESAAAKQHSDFFAMVGDAVNESWFNKAPKPAAKPADGAAQ